MHIKETLGQIVLKHPKTVSVMNQYKLDYCCGGKDTLEVAINDLSLNQTEVFSALENIIKEEVKTDVKDWTKESYESIINYILDIHHTFMRDVLDELNTNMFKILKVHFKTHGESLLTIHKLFGTLKTELEAHLVKEEENLFPLIISYEKTGSESTKQAIVDFINETEDEHDAAGDIFKALSAETNDYTAPDGVCYTYKRTFELLDALEKDTFNHIHMENSVLFELI